MADGPDTAARDSPGTDAEPQVRRSTAAAVFLVSLVVVLVAVEMASRALLPDGYFVWPPGFQMTFDAGDAVGGVAFPGTLTINSIGMRGDEPTGGEAYRILAVGGSATICAYLTMRTSDPTGCRRGSRRRSVAGRCGWGTLAGQGIPVANTCCRWTSCFLSIRRWTRSSCSSGSTTCFCISAS